MKEANSRTPELPVLAPRCLHLQSKAMAVHGESFANDPDYQDGLTDYWCVKSARSIGPDMGPLGPDVCADPNRECYEEY
jgi:hypothetical protein